MKTLTKFVIFCIAVIVIYTITAIVFQCATDKQLADSLTIGVYGFFGTELCASAVLKWLKIRKSE